MYVIGIKADGVELVAKNNLHDDMEANEVVYKYTSKRLSAGGEKADYEPKNVQSLYHLRMWTNGFWSVEYRSSVYASTTASQDANKLRLSL